MNNMDLQNILSKFPHERDDRKREEEAKEANKGKKAGGSKIFCF